MKALQDTGLTALCNHVKSVRSTAEAAGTAVSELAAATSDSLAEVDTTLDTKQDKPASVTVTLTASGWDSSALTQTVTVSGVSATETAQLIQPVPAIASIAAYYDAGILCTGQAANSLTFTCDTAPDADLTVYVVITALT